MDTSPIKVAEKKDACTTIRRSSKMVVDKQDAKSDIVCATKKQKDDDLRGIVTEMNSERNSVGGNQDNLSELSSLTNPNPKFQMRLQSESNKKIQPEFSMKNRLMQIEMFLDSLVVELNFIFNKNPNVSTEIIYQKLDDCLDNLYDDLTIDKIVQSKLGNKLSGIYQQLLRINDVKSTLFNSLVSKMQNLIKEIKKKVINHFMMPLDNTTGIFSTTSTATGAIVKPVQQSIVSSPRKPFEDPKINNHSNTINFVAPKQIPTIGSSLINVKIEEKENNSIPKSNHTNEKFPKIRKKICRKMYKIFTDEFNLNTNESKKLT